MAVVIEYKQDTVVYEVPLSQIRNAVNQPINARYFIETENNGNSVQTAALIPLQEPETIAINEQKSLSLLVERNEIHTDNVELKFNARYCDVRLFTNRKRYTVSIDGIRWNIVTEKVYGCPRKTPSNLLMFSGDQCKRFTVSFFTKDVVTKNQICEAFNFLVPTSLRNQNQSVRS